jgi:hypothetical protein
MTAIFERIRANLDADWQRIRAHLIDDWTRCYRLFSVQLHLVMGTWTLIYAVMPALDPSIAAMLPSPFQKPVIGAYAVLGVLTRVIAQKAKADG